MNKHTGVSADNRFAIIPHWVIFSGISDSGLRLYAVLTKYANNETGKAWPSRSSLAGDIKKSEKTVDRAIKELVEIKALKVTRRRREGTKENYSNLYTVITAHPNPSVIPDLIEVDHDPAEDEWIAEEYGATFLTPRRDTSDAVTIPTELDPLSSTSDASAPGPQKNCTSDKSDNLSRSKQASPATNPGGLTQGQRKILRNQLVVIGKMLESGKKFYSDDVQEQWDTFIGMVEDAFPDDFDMQFADMLLNGKWTVSAKVATPYGAGVELNKIVNTALSL